MDVGDTISTPAIRGNITIWRVIPRRDGSRYGFGDRQLFSQANQIQVGWGAVASRCCGLGDRDFRIAAMYLEYENVVAPEDPVSIPVYDREEGREYYQELAFSSTRDFLRVPLLLSPTIGIETGSEDYFITGETGNKLTFHAQSQGTLGFHGKAFSEGANSKVCGVALVATPLFSDPTQDIIFARTYFAEENQAAKLASSQLGVTWDIVFG